MVWRATDPEGHEGDKAVKWLLVPYTRGQGLDVGCGTHKPRRKLRALITMATAGPRRMETLPI